MELTVKSIAEKIDKSHILYSFIKVASQKKEDGYHFDPETTVGIYFGELQQPYESERVKAVNDIFEKIVSQTSRI